MTFRPLQAVPHSYITWERFRGLNRTQDQKAGEFADMENFSSEGFPCLQTSRGRRLHLQPDSPTGILCKDALCHCAGSKFYVNGYGVEMGLSPEPKDLVSMGAYVIILPDKKYINTADLTDQGNIEASFSGSGTLALSLCDSQGADISLAHTGSAAPEAQEGYWLDTGTGQLMQWSVSMTAWVAVESTYVKLAMPGIGKAFCPYDGVVLSGFREVTDPISGEMLTGLESLEGGAVIQAKGEDFLVIPGKITENRSIRGNFRLERKMPAMDCLVEAGNRLWGCRYGMNDAGEFVNEIYASKLGDFKNWQCYEGISSDSYAVSVGTDGPFTGCANHLGYPIFFKEQWLHKVYGSYPAVYSLQVTPCRGVQAGSGGSIALVGDTLYYKSRFSVCAYDGSLPREVSRELGSLPETAVAGALGNKYYMDMSSGLYVLDTARGLWHRESPLSARQFAAGDSLYALDGEGKIWDVTGGAEGVAFSCETGELGLSGGEHQYADALLVRMKLEAGAWVEFHVGYEGRWESLGILRSDTAKSFCLPLRPRRCDRIKLKLTGWGGCTLYSLRLRTRKGSVMAW